MKNLTINIQINDSDTNSDILKILMELMNFTNDMSYPIVSAFIGETEIFGYIGLSREFFEGAEWRVD